MMKETLRDLALDEGLDVREIDMDLIRQPPVLDAPAEGEAKGRAVLLLHLFRQRFGEIPEGVEAKVRSAPRSDL